jgi:hypothetical protein
MGLRLIAGWLIFCAGMSVPARAQTGSVAEQYLFQAANYERARVGLPSLRWDAALYRAAYAHAREMAARESISHQYAGEPELAERGKSAGGRFSVIAENVAEAPTAVRIHDAWMNSPGHRENLLDPRVDSVGISVLRRGGQLYAVQDFDRAVATLSLAEQERTVAQQLMAAGAAGILTDSEDARRTCGLATGYAGARQPRFVMRYTSSDLSRIPEQLRQKLATGAAREAVVGACAGSSGQPFSMYSIAVLLYP